MMHMLNSMVVQPNIGSFERDLMYTLAIPVVRPLPLPLPQPATPL